MATANAYNGSLAFTKPNSPCSVKSRMLAANTRLTTSISLVKMPKRSVTSDSASFSFGVSRCSTFRQSLQRSGKLYLREQYDVAIQQIRRTNGISKFTNERKGTAGQRSVQQMSIGGAKQGADE